MIGGLGVEQLRGGAKALRITVDQQDRIGRMEKAGVLRSEPESVQLLMDQMQKIFVGRIQRVLASFSYAIRNPSRNSIGSSQQ